MIIVRCGHHEQLERVKINVLRDCSTLKTIGTRLKPRLHIGQANPSRRRVDDTVMAAQRIRHRFDQFRSIKIRSVQFRSIQFRSVQVRSVQLTSVQVRSVQFRLPYLRDGDMGHAQLFRRRHHSTPSLPLSRIVQSYCKGRFSSAREISRSSAGYHDFNSDRSRGAIQSSSIRKTVLARCSRA